MGFTRKKHGVLFYYSLLTICHRRKDYFLLSSHACIQKWKKQFPKFLGHKVSQRISIIDYNLVLSIYKGREEERKGTQLTQAMEFSSWHKSIYNFQLEFCFIWAYFNFHALNTFKIIWSNTRSQNYYSTVSQLKDVEMINSTPKWNRALLVVYLCHFYVIIKYLP